MTQIATQVATQIDDYLRNWHKCAEVFPIGSNFDTKLPSKLRQICKISPTVDQCAQVDAILAHRLMLEEARKLTSSREILLWMTPSEAPKALQASECSELLDPTRASCWIFAQR